MYALVNHAHSLKTSLAPYMPTFFISYMFNIPTWTPGRLCHPSEPHLGKAVPLLWVWGFWVLDMAVLVSVAHVHSGRHWFLTLIDLSLEFYQLRMFMTFSQIATLTTFIYLYFLYK